MDTSLGTALALSRAFSLGEADPVSVVRAALEKVARARAVVISFDAERALAMANESAKRWKNRTPLSVLDGVPLVWKDLFDIAGTITTAGSAIMSTRAPASRDAPMVAAAFRGGLICVGKANLSEFAYSGLGLNPHFGTPTNPALDVGGARVPGGSSSGSAIAVATGLTPLAVGTDTAGSIRIPAAFNGIVGYRASTSRYPRRGINALSTTLDTAGPLARSVADCVAFDSVVREVPPAPAKQALLHQRFVVDPTLIERYLVTSAVADNLQRFVGRLLAVGAEIEYRPIVTLEHVYKTISSIGWLGGLEAFEKYRRLLDSQEAVRIDPRVLERLELARSVPTTRISELIKIKQKCMASFAYELNGATLIAPTVAHVAPTLAEVSRSSQLFSDVNFRTLAITMTGSFLDAPSIALPSGKDMSKLPTSVQIMRTYNDDDTLLAIGLAIERELQSGR